MLAVVFVVSCGDGGRDGYSAATHDKQNSAAITFELQIQPGNVNERNVSPDRSAAEADICQDYRIDTIEAIVTGGAGPETKRVMTWPCSNHSGMIDNLPANVRLI